MDVQQEVTRRFETEVLEVCDRIFTEGVRQMEKSMEYAGLVMTGELRSSLYSERSYVTGELEVQFRMGMRGYGRFKDMKKLRYPNFPDVDGLVEFVEGVGIEKFINNDTVTIGGKSVTLFVPGYHINTRRGSGHAAITAQRTATRIAYAIGRSMQDRNTLKRSKNPFYNVNKGDIYADISEYLSKKLPAEMMEALKDYYERPFYEKEGYHE